MLRYSRLFLLLAGAAALELGLHSRKSGRQDVLAGRENVPTTLPGLRVYTLKHFTRDFNRDYVPGTLEWIRRKMIFQANMQHVMSMRSTPGLSWKPGVTEYMDWTEAEWLMLMGYKGGRPADPPRIASVNSTEPELFKLPAEFSVIHKHKGDLNSVVHDQGHCGSCWAVSAITSLEGQMQTNKELMSELGAHPSLSTQAVLSCTENLDQCGGTGGCKGATGWLALEQIKHKGVPLEKEWPYTAEVGECMAEKFSPSVLRIGIRGYTTLAKNQLAPLKTALVTTGGPVIVSVAASGWRHYTGGVYSDGHPGEFLLNHAVNLMGYSEQSSNTPMGYWLCKNSWGKNFGEEGYIRLLMRSGTDEQSHCGKDPDTFAGQACKNDPGNGRPADPSTDWACGTCGILYHGVYPTEPYIMKA